MYYLKQLNVSRVLKSSDYKSGYDIFMLSIEPCKFNIGTNLKRVLNCQFYYVVRCCCRNKKPYCFFVSKFRKVFSQHYVRKVYILPSHADRVGGQRKSLSYFSFQKQKKKFVLSLLLVVKSISRISDKKMNRCALVWIRSWLRLGSNLSVWHVNIYFSNTLCDVHNIEHINLVIPNITNVCVSANLIQTFDIERKSDIKAVSWKRGKGSEIKTKYVNVFLTLCYVEFNEHDTKICKTQFEHNSKFQPTNQHHRGMFSY